MQIYFKELDNGYTVVYDDAVESCGFDEANLKRLIKEVDKKTCGTDIYLYEPQLAKNLVVITIKSELIFPVSASIRQHYHSWRLDILTWALKEEHTIKFLH
jgi:hypothetical protein